MSKRKLDIKTAKTSATLRKTLVDEVRRGEILPSYISNGINIVAASKDVYLVETNTAHATPIRIH